MKSSMAISVVVGVFFMVLFLSVAPSSRQAYAYPPGVGILSKSKNCLACHANNGPWGNETNILVDIIEKDSKKSFKQPDGSFLLQVNRYEPLTVRTVIGYKKHGTTVAPYRNGWTYVDPSTIETSSFSKFAPAWDVNLQLACRLVGDTVEGYDDFDLTVLPMTVRPLDAARNGAVTLQLMVTRGESVKGKAKEGMVGNYFERTVRLVVVD